MGSRVRVDFINYPKKLTILAFKNERLLEVWGYGDNHLEIYPRASTWTAYSGVLGPKLREGDRQIPEVYMGLSI